MASDDPQIQTSVDFFKNIIPAFARKLDTVESMKLGVNQVTPQAVENGKAYVFAYRNPKGYETNKLKYHHVFPASIVIENTKSHVTAINPYYIPPDVRKKVIDYYYSRLDQKNTIPNVNARSLLEYRFIKNNSLGARIKPAIKKYIKSRMSPVVLNISPALWEDFYNGATSTVMEKFWKNTTPSTVYRDYIISFLKGGTT